MSADIIPIEEHPAMRSEDLKKLLLLVPPKQRDDIDLQRLILFRLKLDGLDSTRAYLVEKFRAADSCGFSGRLYDYLKDDTAENNCKSDE